MIYLIRVERNVFQVSVSRALILTKSSDDARSLVVRSRVVAPDAPFHLFTMAQQPVAHMGRHQQSRYVRPGTSHVGCQL